MNMQPQIIENVPLYPGKRYQVRWINNIPLVQVEVWTGSRGRTWRTLNGYGRANRDKERRAVLTQIKIN